MTKSHNQPKGWLVGKQQVDDWLARASDQLASQDCDGAIRTCKRILKYLPRKDKVCAEALGMVGMAYALQKKFEESYQTLSEAVQIAPENAYICSTVGFRRGSLRALGNPCEILNRLPR